MKKIGDIIIQNPKSKIKIRDVEKGEFIFFRSGKNTLSHNKKIIDGENIFLSTGGTANVHYFSGDAAYSTDVFCITTDPSICNTRYLYYKILSMIEVINNDMFKGTTIKHLQKDEFKNIEFNIQSIHEQKRIVEKLDTCMEQIDKAIQNVEKNIQNAEELFQSQLNEIFIKKNNWESKKIIDICLVTDYVANGSFRSLKENVKYMYEKDYAILLRTTDFTNNFKKSFVYVSKDSYDFLKKSYVEVDDIVICNVGSVGRIFLVPNLNSPMTIGPNSILIRSLDSERLINKYFYYLFLSPYGQSLIERITTGTTQLKFNKTNFRQLDIPIPSLNEQKKIIQKLQKQFSLSQCMKLNYQKEIFALKELKQSILEKAFNGEL